MIVGDASVLANALADDQDDGDIARRELRVAGAVAAPDLVDVETVSVLRKRWLRRTLSDKRFATAIAHLQQLGFERVPTLRLVQRAFELRANVSAYDACYVALAERLDCELITVDVAAGHRHRSSLPYSRPALTTPFTRSPDEDPDRSVCPSGSFAGSRTRPVRIPFGAGAR